MRRAKLTLLAAIILLGPFLVRADAPEAVPSSWLREWPDTDFSKATIDIDEIVSGGVSKDTIPSIDAPEFKPVQAIDDLPQDEPVVSLTVDGVSKAYPLRILTWHEIVNDRIGGLPIAVTYCPLCNAAIVFDRRVGERILEFGTTGKLRHSDLIMYDRQTESWWQQFLGEAIVGELVGTRLRILPARLESFGRFAEAHPEGRVLVPNQNTLRPYGTNPYRRYDSRSGPYSRFFEGQYPDGIEPMAYVVAVGEEAWSLDLLRSAGKIEAGELTLRWDPGMRSALDDRTIAEGREIGNVVVTRNGEPVAYDLTFAFVFHAFRPNGTIHKND